MFEPNNEPNFSLYQNIDKNRETKIEKLFWGQNCLKRIMSQLLEYTKNDKKSRKNQKINFSGQNCLKIFEFLTPTKLTKNREKNREQLFLAQNCLNRIMSQLLDNTNKTKKNRGEKS